MFATRLKELRKKHNLTQKQFAEIFNIASGTVAMWETNKRKPDFDTAIKIAAYFNVSTDYILGQKEKASELSETNKIIPFGMFKQIPILGTIACGEPILAEENIEGYTNIEVDLNADFALRCKGDSMSPKFIDGDIVLIRQQPTVENGQVAAVLIDNEATLKHVYIFPNEIMLTADNPAYMPIVIYGEALNNVRILGKAIGYTRVF